ncbi:MAG: sigma-70 family RNA polymerase sigma factor [Methylococcales bacterium]|nr:sigma-70 family RNA polymerase sigma factor [Methylococcaceae bacterium]
MKFLENYSPSFVDDLRYGSLQFSNKASQHAMDQAVTDLLDRIKHQDRDAFQQFYDNYAQRIGSFLIKQLKNHDLASEAVNDVMLAIWQHAGDFDPAKGKFTTWLFGIAFNKGLKIQERVRRFAVEQPEINVSAPTEGRSEPLDPSSTPEQIILAWELLDALNDGLESLSAEHREVIELSYAGDHSYQEIADLLGCPANTIKTRVFHARKKLFERLERKGYTPTAFQQGRWL